MALQDIRRVDALEQRVEIPAVQHTVVDQSGALVLVARGGWLDRAQVQNDTHPGRASAHVAAHHRRGHAVREQQVVGDAWVQGRVGEAGGVGAGGMAEPRHDPGLVVRYPVVHTVAQPVRDDLRVVGEAVDCLAVGPAATVLQGLGQVPVVERDERPDAALEQELDQAIVEVEPRSVGPPASFRLHARPGHREAVGAQAHLAHQGHVVAGAMIVIVGGLTGAAVGDLARDGGEDVPNALAPPILMRRALDLIGARGRAPEKVRWHHPKSPPFCSAIVALCAMSRQPSAISRQLTADG